MNIKQKRDYMRRRKPEALKNGNHLSRDQRKKQIKQESYVGGKALSSTPPRELKPILAKKLYKYIVKSYPNGILSTQDKFLVEQLCLTLVHLHQEERLIKKYGLIIFRPTARGKVMEQNQAFRERTKTLAMFVKLSSTLGMSPSDRTKLTSLGNDNIDSAMAYQDPLYKILHPSKSLSHKLNK